MNKNKPQLLKARHGHLAKSQVELEEISNQEKHSEIIDQHVALGEGGYYSASEHGRALLRSELSDGQPRLKALSEAFEERHKKLHGNALATKPLKNLVEAIGAAMDVVPFIVEKESERRHAQKAAQGLDKLPPMTASVPPPYAPGTSSPFDILALVVMKVFVDQLAIGRSDEDDWPPTARIYQRIGRALQFEYKSAVCYFVDPFRHQDLKATWTRAHQTPSNKFANLNNAFRKIADETAFNLGDYQWSLDEQAQVGRTLAEVFVCRMNLVEKVKPKWLPDKECRDVVRIRPVADLIDSFKELMEQMAQGRVIGYPMIEQPQQWTLDDPTSGGYHSPVLREVNQVVRGHDIGGNCSTPNQEAVDLLNLLGNTAYQPDHLMMGAFRWSIDNRYKESGLPLRPSPTREELDEQGREHDRKRESGEIEWADDSQEVTDYRIKRKEQYDIAIKAESRFFRTIESLNAIEPIKEFDNCWFSFSCDYRGRMYPQQSFLQPQSTSAEKSLLRFRDGEQITSKAQRDAINEALGVAWKGNKMSLDARREYGKQAVQQILPLLSNEPDDLSTVIKAGADEPWDLLKILYCYKRWDQDDALWDVGLGLDASQSGLQLLSGMLLDTEGLTNTNVLLPSTYTRGDGPVDGYAKVIGEARNLVQAAMNNPEELVQKLGIEGASKLQQISEVHGILLHEILWHESVRKVGKSVVLPLPYGSKWAGTRDGLSTVLSEDLGIDLTKWGLTRQMGEGESWRFHGDILDTLTTYMRTAARLVFPQAMDLMDWLNVLASKSIAQQVKRGEFPHLRWQTHDGFNIEYWQAKQETFRTVSTTLGEAAVSIGDSDQPRKRKMVSAFAPNVVHALDACLLRELFKGWRQHQLPITTIHDCVLTLPSGIPLVRENVKEAFITVCEQNTPAMLAAQMGVSMDDLPTLEIGNANLRDVRNSEFMFH